ncbi:MAG: threonine/serine dehydratase [Rhizobiales bacterium]|nr:threonine/serine dehydratase [Hyphomicrobiales bacterium]
MRKAPDFQDVVAASERLAGMAVHTPLLENQTLNARVGGRVLIKPETLQRTGTFKFRGAYNRISQIQEVNPGTPIVAFSSGNHAQGVAAAAKIHGVECVIVMPSDAPQIKLDRTRAHGADVVIYDRKEGNRDEIASEIAKTRGAILVPPYDDAGVIAGQGTVGYEILQDCAAHDIKLDAILVPCGGGGLTAGTILAVQGLAPDVSVYTVEPEGFDDTMRSLASGTIEHNAALTGSICDALLSPSPGDLTFSINGQALAGGLVISDAAALAAVRFAAQELKLIVEPGGAAALAALLSGVYSVEGKTVAIILSGGNIDPAILIKALELNSSA